MKITIDATNIKAGGGLTHLKRLLEFFNSDENTKVEIIGGGWLSQIENASWLTKKLYPESFKSIFQQELFKKNKLPGLLSMGDIAFIPGGTFSSPKVPYISMSQNMLVFEKKERDRFPRSFTWLRYNILERLQLRSFKNAKGIIYISHYAKNYIENKYPELKKKKAAVIYHGISDSFRQSPKVQFDITSYTNAKPFKILYISIINFYKHQWHLVNAVKKLKAEGLNIELELIGPIYKPAEKLLKNSLQGSEDYISYKGMASYDEISKYYKEANMFVFASTCENMPNILLEAMSAGLPILSSNYGPMPEILKDGGVYMDPTDEMNIYSELKKILLDIDMRKIIAEKAYSYALNFSWKKTSEETFKFIGDVAKENKIKVVSSL